MPFLTVNQFTSNPNGTWTTSTPGTTGVVLGLATGTGADLPVIASPNTLRIKVVEGTNVEHMDITAHLSGSDSITVTRGVEGIKQAAAACFSFTSAAVVEATLTDLEIQNLHQIDRANVVTAQSSNPSTPSAGRLLFYAKTLAGRILLKWLAPTGVDYHVQPSLFGNQAAIWKPGTGTTLGVQIGIVFASNGTLSTPAITATGTTHYNQVRRQRWANVVTTTNQALGLSTAVAMVWRGSAAGLGGFFFHARVAFPLFPAGTRVFVGLSSLLTTGMVTADVTGATGQYIGMGMIAGDTNLTIMHSDGTTLAKDALSPAQARLASTWFDVVIFAGPNQSSINVRVDRYDQTTGAQTTIYDAAVSTNIPAAATLLAPHALMSNGTANTTATTVAIENAGTYLESDF